MRWASGILREPTADADKFEREVVGPPAGEEALLSAVTEPDWFHEPVLEPRVHRCFLDLSAPDLKFVEKLEANMGPNSPFPGGSYYCLQVLRLVQG